MKKSLSFLAILALFTILFSSLVSAGYDLEVSEIRVFPTYLEVGTSTQVRIIITNHGPDDFIADTNNYENNPTLYLDIQDDNLLPQITQLTFNIATGQQEEWIIGFAWQNAGWHNISVYLSDNGEELNPDNNFLSKMVYVIQPSINLSFDETENMESFRGENVDKTYTLRNIGTKPATITNIWSSYIKGDVYEDEEINSELITITQVDVIDDNSTEEITISFPVAEDLLPQLYTGSLFLEYIDLEGNTQFINQPLRLDVINQEPVVEDIPDSTLFINQEFSYQVLATDNDDMDILSYSLSNAPDTMLINETTGLITWTPTTSFEPTSITVVVSDGFSTVSKSFALNAQEQNGAQLSASIEELLVGGRFATRTGRKYFFFEITNTGNTRIENLSGSILDLSGNPLSNIYDHDFKIRTPSLEPGQSKVIQLDITIPATQQATLTQLGDIIITGFSNNEEVSTSIDLFMQARQYLTLGKFYIEVDGNRDRIHENETYDKLKEGEDFILAVIADNNHVGFEKKIEDIVITVMDDEDWNIKAETAEFDLDGDVEEEIEFSFSIPDTVVDRTTVTIKISGTDKELGFVDEDTLTFDLMIDRSRDEVSILSWDLSDDPVSCSDEELDVDVIIRNSGSNDQDRVTVLIEGLDELDFSKEFSDISLDSLETKELSFSIDVEDLDEDFYEFEVSVFYDDTVLSSKELIAFDVRCSSQSSSGFYDDSLDSIYQDSIGPLPPTTTNNEVIISYSPQVPIVNKPVQESSTSFFDSETYFTLLVSLVTILLVLVLSLGISLIIKTKKGKK